jgi:hypothetical protein
MSLEKTFLNPLQQTNKFIIRNQSSLIEELSSFCNYSVRIITFKERISSENNQEKLDRLISLTLQLNN